MEHRPKLRLVSPLPVTFRLELATEWVQPMLPPISRRRALEAKVAKTVEDLAQRHEASIEQQRTEFDKRIEDYEAELAKRPDSKCVLND